MTGLNGPSPDAMDERALLDALGLRVRYLLLDVEATHRENRSLRMLLESQMRPEA